MAVYVDLLFLLNLAMNYWTLWATSTVLRRTCRPYSILVSAALGSVAAFLWLMLPVGLGTEVLLKLVVALLMTQFCFMARKVSEILANTVVFFLCSTLCAGVAMAMGLSGGKGTGLTGSPIGVAVILLSPLILTPFVWQLWPQLAARLQQLNPEVKLRIWFGEDTFTFTAAVDTGHSLREPFSQRPVVVVRAELLEEMLGYEVVTLLKTWSGDPAIISDLPQKHLSTRLVFIPYTTISSSGVMPGFRTDRCEVWSQSGWVEVGVVVGLARTGISMAGHSALVSQDLALASSNATSISLD